MKSTLSNFLLFAATITIWLGQIKAENDLLSLHYPSPTKHQQKHLIYNLTEERPVGSIITSDLTEDAGFREEYSKDVVDKFQYVLLSNSQELYTELFSIDSQLSRLTTAAVIDREKICERMAECVIQLKTAIQHPFFQVIKVDINIIDINDNAPVFNPSSIQMNLSESQAIGRLFPISGASDLDSPLNGVKQYRLISSPTGKNDKFSLEQSEITGLHLMLEKSLDRESVNYYELLLLAVDNGKPALTGTLTLQISVTDVNDHSPVFDNSVYNVSISEDAPIGSTLVTLHASDADLHHNGRIRYRLSDKSLKAYPNLFSIDEVTGTLKLDRELDREQKEVYFLLVMAEDGGTNPLASAASVILNVDDVNDNKPHIIIDAISDGGKLEVGDQAPPGTRIAYLTVEDSDSGDAGRAKCSLNSDRPGFKLDEKSDREYFLSTTDQLHVNKDEILYLTISCQDLAQPPLISESRINISVVDSRKSLPRFVNPIYEVSLKENNEIGTSVVTVSAVSSDADVLIYYHLDRNESRFRVDETTGTIYATMKFNREVNDVIEFRVSALSSLQVSYGLDRTLMGTHHDKRERRHPIRHSGQRLLSNRHRRMISLVHSNNSTKTSNEKDKTSIVLQKSNSRDSDDTRKDHVESCLVRVNITDEDDNVPRFASRKYIINISQPYALNSSLGNVTAIDQDLWPHNQTWYDIDPESNSASCFKIGLDSGTLTSSCFFDQLAGGTYNLTVRSNTPGIRGWVDTTSVVLKFSNLTYAIPVLIYPLLNNYTIYINPQLTHIGQTITIIRAQDGGQSQKSEYAYSLSGQGSEYFEMDSRSGRIILTKSVRYSNSTLIFYLEVIATSSLLPSVAINGTLNIVITNDAVKNPDRQIASKEDVGFSVGIISTIIICVLIALFIIIISLIVLCPRIIKDMSQKKHRPKIIREVVDNKFLSAHEANEDSTPSDDVTANHNDVTLMTSLPSSSGMILMLDSEPVNYSARQRWIATGADSDSLCTEMTTSVTSYGSAREDKTDANTILTPSFRYFGSSYLNRTNMTWPRGSQSLDSPSTEELPPPPSPFHLHEPRYQITHQQLSLNQPQLPMTTSQMQQIKDYQHLYLPYRPTQQTPRNGDYVSIERRRPIATHMERVTTFGVRMPPGVTNPATKPTYRIPRTFSSSASLSDQVSAADFERSLLNVDSVPPPMKIQQRSLTNGSSIVRSASQNSRKSVRFADDDDDDDDDRVI